MNTPGINDIGFQSSSSNFYDDSGVSNLVSEDDTETPAPDISSVLVNLPEVCIETLEVFLAKIHEEVAAQFYNLCFAKSNVEAGSKQVPILTISQRHLFVHPPYGMLSRIQGYVRYKEYSVHVMMRLWRRRRFEDTDDIIALCKIIDEDSHYKFCPGIDYKVYMKDFYEVIRFHLKSVRLTDFPFCRVDSVKCDLLFELAHNATKEEKDAVEVKCYSCKRLVRDLERQIKRTTAETPTRKTKRQNPSSRARLSYMSPSSQAKHKKLAQYDRTNSIRKLARYEEYEVTLNDDQNEEMKIMVEKIGDENLQKLYDEGKKYGVGGIMKDIWITDLDRQRKEFSHDQASSSKIIMCLYTYVC